MKNMASEISMDAQEHNSKLHNKKGNPHSSDEGGCQGSLIDRTRSRRWQLLASVTLDSVLKRAMISTRDLTTQPEPRDSTRSSPPCWYSRWQLGGEATSRQNPGDAAD
jgi:hypothetical protein